MRTKEIIVGILVLMVVLFTLMPVTLATGETPWPPTNGENGEDENGETETPPPGNQTPPPGGENTTPPPGNQTPPPETTTPTGEKEGLPEAGLDNFPILIIIGICGVTAVYAFKKMRDYKTN